MTDPQITAVARALGVLARRGDVERGDRNRFGRTMWATAAGWANYRREGQERLAAYLEKKRLGQP